MRSGLFVDPALGKDRFNFKGKPLAFATVGICNKCKNRKLGTDTCRAFPDGIPEEILMGEFMHILPYEGDNEIHYEPRPGIVG